MGQKLEQHVKPFLPHVSNIYLWKAAHQYTGFYIMVTHDWNGLKVEQKKISLDKLFC